MSRLSFTELYKMSGLKAGIKASGKHDLGVLFAVKPVIAAGAFTLNKVCAAPVKISRKHIKAKTHRAMIVNAGNANACTGEEGMQNAIKMCDLVAKELGCSSEEVLVCSTGVIGVQLPFQKIEKNIPVVIKAASNFSDEETFELSIMTTDLVPKIAIEKLSDGSQIKGFCKGSGMIHPNMATMLGFVATDAVMDKKQLDEAVKFSVERSFNSLSVDGDTSTNDSVLVFAQEGSAMAADEFKEFKEGLEKVCVSLAKQIAKDGEGAGHLVTIEVTGGRTFESARKIARSVANSPLVKTAIAGNDPNWGRILCAVGYSGEDVEESKIEILIEDICVYKEKPLAFSDEDLSAKMGSPEITIKINLNLGQASASFYTCDFTHGYISINADYRT